MREYLNENTLFNDLAMQMQTSRALLLVVEGADDELALYRHLSSDLQVRAGVGGKQNVLGAAHLANVRGLKGVRFLVDRDYDDYKGLDSTELENVIYSTNHDVFMDLLVMNPSNLSHLIKVYASPASRRPGAMQEPQPDPSEIQNEAFSLASSLSAVRIVSEKYGLNLKFQGFSFSNLGAKGTDVRSIANTVIERSLSETVDSEKVIQESISTYEQISKLPIPPVGDHDFFSALATVLRKFNNKVSPKELRKSFIVAIGCDLLSANDWFVRIQEWCKANGRVGFSCGSMPAH